MNVTKSGAVKKLKGWKPQAVPPEDEDMLVHRRMLEKIIISVVNARAQPILP